MTLQDRELDDLLTRVAARHWFERPRTAAMTARFSATRSSPRWPIWVLTPLLAACAGASYVAVQHVLHVPVRIRVDDGTGTLDTGMHVLRLDEHGPRPIVVDLPDRGPVEFRVELPPDMTPEQLRDARFEVLFSTDPGK